MTYNKTFYPDFIYHATPVEIDIFNLEHLDGSELNFGPGIYFSDKADNIDFYLEENPNGNIYKTALDISNNNIVNWYDIIDYERIFVGIEKYFNIILNINKLNTIQKFSSQYRGKNYLYLMSNLETDLWKITKKPISIGHSKQFLNIFTEFTNIDVMFMENGTFRNEYVVFNPKILNIIEKVI